jgi:hypothetical protein
MINPTEGYPEMTADHATDLELWARRAAAAAEIARGLAGTAFIPDSLKVYYLADPDADENKPGNRLVDEDATTAQVAAVILTGSEVGLPIMASLRSMDVIGGTPAFRALTIRAILQDHGHDIWTDETTSQRAIVSGRRRMPDGSWGKTETSTWDMNRARQLAPRGFHSDKGQWKRQPTNMLLARATAETGRKIGAAELLGIGYAAEELDDEGRPEVDTPAEDAPPPSPRTARRQRQPGPALPAGNGDPAPDPRAPIADDDKTRIRAGLRKLGITKPGAMRDTINSWLGFVAHNGDTPPGAITRMDELDAEQAAAVLSTIDAALARLAADGAGGDAEPGPGQDGGNDGDGDGEGTRDDG